MFRVLVVCLLCFLVNVHGFVRTAGSRFLSQRPSLTSFASTIGREVVSYPKDLAPIEINNHMKLVDIHDCDFFDCVLDSEGLSVVIFSSDWCGPCKTMEANLVELSMRHRSEAKFYRIDTDTQPDAATDFSIRSIPSILFFKRGRVVSEIVGAVPSSVVVSQILKHNTATPLI